MAHDDRAVVGILGGLGPWATLELFRRILQLTPAERDQDHLHIIIENNPSVPERTAAILGHGESPLPALIEGARRLAAAGADFIVMPCNTAHHWIDELAGAVGIPILDMVAEALEATLAVKPDVRRAGLLATTGTVRSGLYQRRFRDRGVEVLVPDEAAQRDLVMGAIFGPAGIKAGRLDPANRDRLVRASRQVVEAGGEVLLAACTEIPLVLRPGDVRVPLIDTLDCLARAAVRRALSALPAYSRAKKNVGQPRLPAPQGRGLGRNDPNHAPLSQARPPGGRGPQASAPAPNQKESTDHGQGKRDHH